EPSEASVPAAPSEVSAPAAPAEASAPAAPAEASESAASAEDAASSASPVSDAAGALSSAGKAAAGGDDPAAKLKEAAGFSKTLTGAWDSMKGMDFSEKAAFVKKGMDLVSKAKDHIGMLKNLAPLLSGDMGKQLMSQVGGLSGNLGDLSGLFGKAGSIGAGDWGSYKDQIGSAIKGLSGGFSGLGSL
ncbi:MAG: hypothetical protein ACLFSZ_09835, partial [Puniceicoccaceae bacterium]